MQHGLEDQAHGACMMVDDDDRAMIFGLEDQARARGDDDGDDDDNV